MLEVFKYRKLYKEFVSGIKEGGYDIKEVREKLKKLPIEVVKAIGKKIIYSDYDGYNGMDKSCKLAYFDDLDRWQKEFFIVQRLYKLYT